MEAASLPQLKNIGAVKSDMVADEEKDSEVPDWFSSYDKKKEDVARFINQGPWKLSEI